MKNILVTGSSGFIGSALVKLLYDKSDYAVYTLNRRFNIQLPETIHQIVSHSEQDIFSTEIPLHLDVIVHLAGRAHNLNDESKHPLDEFRKANVLGSIELARQAIDKQVKRFIFISSIGVNGFLTTDKPFHEQDTPMPHADYAISKLEAEEALIELFKNTFTELVIIRPPLVYAAHAPGNFSRLLKIISTNFPLPFAFTHNKRSFIALENLVDFIECCILHQKAKNELFLISDDENISTKQLITHIQEGMGREAKFVYVPDFVLKVCATCLGKKKTYEQLFRSLEVDSSKARDLLGWTPPISTVSALRKVGQTYNKLK